MVNMDGLPDTSSSSSGSSASPAALSNGSGLRDRAMPAVASADVCLDASKMLEAALQQMDGIISGELAIECAGHRQSTGWNKLACARHSF